MGNCVTCDHWDQTQVGRFIWTNENPSEEYGRCEAIPDNEDLIQQPFSAETGTVLAVTHADFGCKLYRRSLKRKDNANP